MIGMSKKRVLETALTIVLVGVLTLTFNTQQVRTDSQTIIVPDNYSTIQGAINAANPGDTIFVKNRTYYEHVVVYKAVSLFGENVETTIIDGNGTGIVVKVTMNSVTIAGFTIRNSGPWPNGGIMLSEVENCNVSRNNITANNGRGIRLYYSSNNIIVGNNITANKEEGIYLSSSSYNTISRNNVTANKDNGIYLYTSSNHNSITGNSIANNWHGIAGMSSLNNSIVGNNVVASNSSGIIFRSLSNSSIIGNSVTGNTWDGICLYFSSNHNNITGNNVRLNKNDGIVLSESSNSNIAGNNVTGNSWNGIYLYSSSNNSITGNDIVDQSDGIVLRSSSNNNIITRNNITGNYRGIYLSNSSDNSIHHNNFISNTDQVLTYDSFNVWDDGYPSGGNYWSDFKKRYPNVNDIYSGPNQNQPGSDSFWDSPYVIDADNKDNYPIVPEFPSFLILPIFMTATLLAATLYRRKHS